MMTPRSKAEAARRRQAAARTAGPREVFAYPYWVSGWAQPFESRWSVYQKYAWINNACSRDHSLLMSRDVQYHEEQANLDARLFAAVPEQYRPPQIHLWEAADFPHAVCPTCLEAGYWSELPQLVGYDHCPLHGIAMQRCCRKCSRPFRFGCPQFGKTGAYVCLTCGEPVTAFPANVCRQWQSHSLDTVGDRFRPLIASAIRISTECEGKWAFPSRASTLDQRLVLHTLTGIRSHLEWDRNWSLLSPGMGERVVSTTFLLPCDEQFLDYELADMRHALIADLMKYCKKNGGVVSGAKTNVKLKTKSLTHEVGIKSGNSLLDNVRSVLEVFQTERNLGWGIEDVIRLSFRHIHTEMPAANQVPSILVALAVWQVARVILWIEALMDKLTACFARDGELSDETRAIFDNQPYSIYLRWWRIEAGHFVFEIYQSSWIPPYRLQCTSAGIKLTVYQIVPAI
jgi:hypothetical protein